MRICWHISVQHVDIRRLGLVFKTFKIEYIKPTSAINITFRLLK